MFRGGPESIISNLAVCRFDKKSGEMYVDTVHPGVTIEKVLENTGFELDISKCRGETKPPTHEEIEILRNKVDPERIFLPFIRGEHE